MDPFNDLNKRLAEKSDQMTKREYFACHILCALIDPTRDDQPITTLDAIVLADGLIYRLKEIPPHG